MNYFLGEKSKITESKNVGIFVVLAMVMSK